VLSDVVLSQWSLVDSHPVPYYLQQEQVAAAVVPDCFGSCNLFVIFHTVIPFSLSKIVWLSEKINSEKCCTLCNEHSYYS